MRRINLHVYPTSFVHDSRMLKITMSLDSSALFDEIHVGAIWYPGLEEHQSLDGKRKVWRVRLKTRSLPEGSFWKVLRFLEWQLRLLFGYRKVNVSVFNAHSLSVLPLGMLFKIFRGSKLVYDTHELETETGMPRFRQRVSKALERKIIPYADLIIVVGNFIAEWYKKEYSLHDVHVIKNVPYRNDSKNLRSDILKRKFGINGDEILFIYQGRVDKTSGVELLLEVFSKCDESKHIVFMGYGSLENKIRCYERLFSNIHFQEAVRPEEVPYYTSSADIGFSVIENTSLSHYYCLPNKLFEYLMNGLPVVASDFPEMGRIIDLYKCGWKVTVEETQILNFVENVSRSQIEEIKANVGAFRDNFGWHFEEEKLIQLYRKLMHSES